MYNHCWELPWNMKEIELCKLRTPLNASQCSLSRMEETEFSKNQWVVFCTPLPLLNFKGERGQHRVSPRMRTDAQSRCKGPHPANQGTTPQKPGSQLQAPDANETLTGGLQLPLLRPLSTSFLNPALPCPLGTIWSSRVGGESSLTWCFILERWTPLHQVSRGTPLYNQAVKQEIMLSPLHFSSLGWEREEVSTANRKPQSCSTTQGRRLEIWPGALPRSRDYKRCHLSLSETTVKSGLPRKE